MLIKCEVPLPSTPDVFDIYSSSIDPTGLPTTESPTKPSTEQPTEPPTEAPLFTTVIDDFFTAESISKKCEFDKDGNRTVFDTGSPYSYNMRPG